MLMMLLIMEGHRAITCEANISHDCYAFHVQKGNRGAHIGAKNMYILGNKHYLWLGKDPIGQLVSIGDNCGVAGNLSPVWQPGFQPCCQVISVNWVNSPPEQLVSQNITTD